VGVVYFSIIPTFEPSRYCKCWIVCFYYSSLVQREVRGRLAEHLLHLPYSYFDEKGSGSILTRFSSDIGEAGNFFSDILPDLLVDIVTVFAHADILYWPLHLFLRKRLFRPKETKRSEARYVC